MHPRTPPPPDQIVYSDGLEAEYRATVTAVSGADMLWGYPAQVGKAMIGIRSLNRQP